MLGFMVLPGGAILLEGLEGPFAFITLSVGGNDDPLRGEGCGS